MGPELALEVTDTGPGELTQPVQGCGGLRTG